MDRVQLVQAALGEVSRWRLDPSSQPDEAVRALLASYPSGAHVGDLLWKDLPSSVSAQETADLLSLWCWRTDDNGAAIMRTIERWIDERADSKKIAVALSLDAYPFVDHEVRLAKLSVLASEFPEHRARCESIIDETRAMMYTTR